MQTLDELLKEEEALLREMRPLEERLRELRMNIKNLRYEQKLAKYGLKVGDVIEIRTAGGKIICATVQPVPVKRDWIGCLVHRKDGSVGIRTEVLWSFSVYRKLGSSNWLKEGEERC